MQICVLNRSKYAADDNNDNNSEFDKESNDYDYHQGLLA